MRQFAILILTLSVSILIRFDLNAFQKSKIPAIPRSVFVYDNAILSQTLTIKSRSNKKLNFQYIVKDKVSNEQLEISGAAVKDHPGDIESDVDEQGNGYFVDEYIYNGDCSLVLRIDVDGFKRAKITATKCNSSRKICLPISSIGIMHKKKR